MQQILWLCIRPVDKEENEIMADVQVMEAKKRRKHQTVIGVALLNTLLFSGIIFGWPALQLLLKQEGQAIWAFVWLQRNDAPKHRS